MILLFCLQLIACEDATAFDLKQYREMELLISYANGQYGDKKFTLHGKTDCFVLDNNTFKCIIKSGSALGKQVYSFNIDSTSIEVLNEFSENLANLNLQYFENMTCYFNGRTIDDKHYISGQFSAIDDALLMTISNFDDDGVFLISGKIPEKLTTYDILMKLTPSFAIVFFFGFGKIYQKRFWKQFNQMNTMTLHKRINEALEKEK